jgi:hypothetical protein
MPSNGYSHSQARRKAWRAVDVMLAHMIENEVITQDDLYMDLREELADVIFDAIQSPIGPAHNN